MDGGESAVPGQVVRDQGPGGPTVGRAQDRAVIAKDHRNGGIGKGHALHPPLGVFLGDHGPCFAAIQGPQKGRVFADRYADRGGAEGDGVEVLLIGEEGESRISFQVLPASSLRIMAPQFPTATAIRSSAKAMEDAFKAARVGLSKIRSQDLPPSSVRMRTQSSPKATAVRESAKATDCRDLVVTGSGRVQVAP